MTYDGSEKMGKEGGFTGRKRVGCCGGSTNDKLWTWFLLGMEGKFMLKMV